MRSIDDTLVALSRSRFRSRFRWGPPERAYVRHKGFDTTLAHADAFIADRLAAAEPLNDGRQTPMRGHPVFVAQHATATCCRSCLETWHKISKGQPLSEAERTYIRSLIEQWLRRQMEIG